MIFYQYKETCGLLLDYPKIGGGGIKDFVKTSIRNIFNASIDVYGRIFIAEFPGGGVKFIENLQSRCSNMTFADKSRYDSIFQQFTHKVGESAMNYIKYSEMHRLCQFQ